MLLGFLILAVAALRWGADSIEGMDHPEWRRRHFWAGFGPRVVLANDPLPPEPDRPTILLAVPPAPAAVPITAPVAVPSALFSQAVQDNSNLEMDWLWLATQVSRDTERRYCLERAFYINPANESVGRALAQLPAAAR